MNCNILDSHFDSSPTEAPLAVLTLKSTTAILYVLNRHLVS